MIGFEEMSEAEQHRIRLELALHDAASALAAVVKDYGPHDFVNYLTELDEISQYCTELCEMGLVALQISEETKNG
jgi:hypothetical protein